MAERKATALWDNHIVKGALIDSMRKFDPRIQARNPVMFVVEVTALAVTIILVENSSRSQPLVGFELQIALWLWFTVGFANFAEAMAEGRGKAQADNLRKTRTQTQARQIKQGQEIMVPATSLRRDDVVMVKAGEVIPGDGEVIEGVAAVNEAAITGESAPCHSRERWRSQRGHRRHHRHLGLDQGAHHGESGRDISRSHDLAGRGRAAPEDAQRNRPEHSARRADHHLHAGLREPVSVRTLRRHHAHPAGAGGSARMPDSDDHRRPALRHRYRRNGSAGAAQRARDVGPRGRGCGRRRYAVARQDRHDHARQPDGDRIPASARRSASKTLADAAQLASLADETPEGRSIVVLAKREYNIRGRELADTDATLHSVHRADPHERR